MSLDHDLTFLKVILDFLKFKNDIIYIRFQETFNYLSNIKKLDSNLLLNILNYNDSYIIFLNSKFFCYPRKLLLNYYRHKKILYFEYDKKDYILWLFQGINFFIENSTLEEKENFRIKYKINKKIKICYFLDNIIEPDTLYKKLYFSKEDIYIPFDFYLLKKIEYKLKSICQISEKLGATKIDILYKYSLLNETLLGSTLSVQNNEIGIVSTKKNNNDQTIKLTFSYLNSHNTFNLNKNYLEYLINLEDQFLISYDEYKTDIDLKYLINARCINMVQKYSTNLVFNSCSEFEKKLLVKSQYFGLELSHNLKNNKIINLTIDIDFLDIYKYTDFINGLNLYIGKEGYQHLIRSIIQESNKNNKKLSFLKLNNFMFENIRCNYKFYEDEYNKLNLKPLDKEKLFYHILNLIENNFSDETLNIYYKEYFKNNQTFYHFLELAYSLCGIYKINRFNFFNKEKYYLKQLFPFFLVIYQYNSVKYLQNYWNNIFNEKFDSIYNRIINNNILFYDYISFDSLDIETKNYAIHKKQELYNIIKKFYLNKIIFTNAFNKYKYINNFEEVKNIVISNYENIVIQFFILIFWNENINNYILFKNDRDTYFVLRLLEDYFMDQNFIHKDRSLIENFNLVSSNQNILEYIGKELPFNYYNIKNKGIYFTFDEYEILKNKIQNLFLVNNLTSI